jgi:hypothetical protein
MENYIFSKRNKLFALFFFSIEMTIFWICMQFENQSKLFPGLPQKNQNSTEILILTQSLSQKKTKLKKCHKKFDKKI